MYICLCIYGCGYVCGVQFFKGNFHVGMCFRMSGGGSNIVCGEVKCVHKKAITQSVNISSCLKVFCLNDYEKFSTSANLASIICCNKKGSSNWIDDFFSFILVIY